MTVLTDGSSDDAQPTFSPDGKRIAFCSNRSGNWHLYAMDLDGRSLSQLTDGAGDDLHPSFSPDGSRLVYCSKIGAEGIWELCTIDLRNGQKTRLVAGLFPVWSPDKSVDRIAFQKTHSRSSKWFSIWTLDVVEGKASRITEVTLSDNAALVTPCWSADGRALAFAAIIESETPAAAGVKQAPRQDIWIINADGKERRRVTDGSATNVSPCWAGDGRLYFISDRSGHDCVWSIDGDSNAQKTAVTDMQKAVP